VSTRIYTYRIGEQEQPQTIPFDLESNII